MTYKQRASSVHVEDYKQNVVLKLSSASVEAIIFVWANQSSLSS